MRFFRQSFTALNTGHPALPGLSPCAMTMATERDPQRVHQEILEQCARAHARLDRRNAGYATARMVVFAWAAAIAIARFGYGALPATWLALPLASFAVLALLHDRVIRAQDEMELRIEHHRAALRRLDGTWPGQGVQGKDLVEEGHPYAVDLDIFGQGSLFELLCTAPTRSGQRELARWLCAPAKIDTLRRRQGAVIELRDQLDLREQLTVIAAGQPAALEPATLINWAQQAPAFDSRLTPLATGIAALLAALAVAAATSWGLGFSGAGPLLGVALAEWIMNRIWQKRLRAEVHTVEKAARQLQILKNMLRFFAQHPVQSPRLQELRARLRGSGLPAATAIAQLTRRVQWLESRRNAFFAPFAYLLMWSLHGTLSIQRWRQRHGERVRGWLEALAELEALGALAGYAYEHPRDPFAELVDEGPSFQACGLGHPLLPEERCVRNDVTLGGEPGAKLNGTLPVWLVSGSNMSGKSTLLRSVGVNAVLALAGAPVRAESLRLSRVQVGASICLQDSLADGASRFYAEITRLKQLMDLAAGSPALLFLIDEILAGTNSHDRRQGAAALIGSFIERGALGLVTTHDLAIADHGDEAGALLRNVHFEDQVIDGELVFDYRLRDGRVTRSNALVWMRAVGLDV